MIRGGGRFWGFPVPCPLSILKGNNMTTNFSALATDAGPVASGEQKAHIANQSNAAGATPTAAEYNLLVSKFNLVLSALREFEILASS